MFPKLIEIGGLYLPTYGALVALGFLAGLESSKRLARRLGLDPENVINLAVYCALAGLVGAKLMMFIFDWEIYAKNPSELFSIETLQSAGVFQGGFLLALVVGVWLMKRYRLPVLFTMDCLAPGVAIGHAIGRLGCFAAGCCWGVRCDRAWGVTFTSVDAGRMTGVPLGVPLHPTQIYESAAEFVLFGLLYHLATRTPRPGTVIGLYLVSYSAVRFFVELFRFHQQPLIGAFSNTQWISAALAVLGVALLAYPRYLAAQPVRRA
ncbi:MAG: prolipoprotein diacylglyceryl transferase [Acidobacteria bacterium]|nr:prolipoprotein diacylglyceryl transferase [Acidobacteriota bacterium]